MREPHRNDILVFDSVEEEGLKVVKRLIGMPGDTLSMEAGQLYRNGQRVDEPYVLHGDPHRSEDPIQRAKMRDWQIPHLVQRDTATYQPDLQDWGPIVVPADSFFMMGDNRAPFGGELSGHYYFADCYNTDSGLRAMIAILNLLQESEETLSLLVAPLNTRRRAS